MNKIVLVVILDLFFLQTNGQITSSEYRDASGSGPFPIYIGLSRSWTSEHSDFKSVKSAFDIKTGNRSGKSNLSGLESFIGVTIIPESKNWPLTLAIELRYFYLSRRIVTPDQRNDLSMSVNQLSPSFGIRFAAFPIVLQLQVGTQLYSKEEFNSTIDNSRFRLETDSSLGINGWNVMFRLGVLDPAGTAGGVGLFFDFGYSKPSADNRLPASFRNFFDSTDLLVNRNPNFFYCSVGLVVPLAIRII